MRVTRVLLEASFSEDGWEAITFWWRRLTSPLALAVHASAILLFVSVHAWRRSLST